MDLTPGQRARLQRLLEDELRAAVSAVRDRGASATTVDATVADRAELLGQLFGTLADDPRDRLDQDGPGDSISEQR